MGSWQIVATLHWMHNDMNCAHLDLTTENVMISNGLFNISDEDGMVTIDRNVSCKIIDFGLAEVFKVRGDNKKYFKYDPDEEVLGSFHINNKYQITANNHQCPEIFNEKVYDARNADMWSFGVLLFFMHFGQYPYQRQVKQDSGYQCIQNQTIHLFLAQNHLSHLSNDKLLQLISGCLCVEETQRFTISDVVKHEWYKKYAQRHRKKMKERMRNKPNVESGDIPYYYYYYLFFSLNAIFEFTHLSLCDSFIFFLFIITSSLIHFLFSLSFLYTLPISNLIIGFFY